MNLGNYKCKSWQTFVQQVINLSYNGYYYFNFYILPENRYKSLSKIDEKLVIDYETNMSKDRKYHHKKAGYANYAYLRHEGMIVVLKTDGKGAPKDNEDDPNIEKRTKYKDFRKEPIVFHPQNEKLSLKIGLKDKQFTLYMSKTSYQRIKQECVDLLIKGETKIMFAKFKALNSLPPYKGIYKQKKAIMHKLLDLSKRHGRGLKKADFKLSNKVIRRKVFITDEK